MTDKIFITRPEEGTPDVVVDGTPIIVEGDMTGGTLKKVWAVIVPDCSNPSPAAPWDVVPEPPFVVPTGLPWSIPVVPSGSGPQCVRVWGAFGNNIVLETDNQPFIGVPPGSGSGGGPVIALVSAACSGRGGIPARLHLTVGRSTCESIVGRVSTLRWNGEYWLGQMQLADGTMLPWKLEVVKPCKNCRAGNFRLSFGDRSPQIPQSVSCEPFQLEFNEKKSVKVGLRGSKICPPGTTAEIIICE